MIRPLLLAAAAALLVGAKAPPAVDYRLAVEADASGAPTLQVEMRLAGDGDGETRIDLPTGWTDAASLRIDGAQVSAPDAAHRLLRHRPGARITVRYRIPSVPGPDRGAAAAGATAPALLRPGYVAATGAQVFAPPEGRAALPANVRLGRLPRGWQAVTSFDPAPRALTVAGVGQALIFAAPGLAAVDIGTARVVRVGGPLDVATLGTAAARVLETSRSTWRLAAAPQLIGVVGLGGLHSGEAAARATPDGVLVAAGPQALDRVPYLVARAAAATEVPGALGVEAPRDAFGPVFTDGMRDAVALRTLFRSGGEPPGAVVERMGGALYVHDHAKPMDSPEARGLLLALRWDDAVRRKTAGRSDLGAVLRRMRDHAARFAAGQAPDLRTGFISAMWVEAGLDVRGDLAAYVDQHRRVDLPERLFDDCLEARVTVSPGFDAGFDATASTAAQTIKGVRRRGPAWNSGLRDGMRLQSLDLHPGDTTREVVAVVRPARGGKARTIRFWPYGDGDVDSRKLQWATGLDAAGRTACAAKIQGLP